MAVHDLRCLACGAVQKDVDIPISQGAKAYCETAVCMAIPDGYWGLCRGTLEPIAAIGRMDASGCGFTPFTFPIEDPVAPGGFREETVSNLADIRRLERTSEQAERNGE